MNHLKPTSTISSIDAAKFLACFLIIILHTKVLEPFLSPEQIFFVDKSILRMAVPFFFVTSGYFLGRKFFAGADIVETVKNYCKRLLLPLFVFSLINIVEHVISMRIEGESYSMIALKVLRSIIFYPFGALWFVQSCIVGSIMLVPFMKYNKLRSAVVLGLILFLLVLPFNSYYFLIYGTKYQYIVDVAVKSLTSLRNGATVGFVYLSMGVWINHLKLKTVNSVYLFIIGGFCFVLMVMETGFVYR